MKNHFIYILPLFLLASIASNAQTLVVTDDNAYVTGQASSVLDIKSTTKGLLVPRMTAAQRVAIASPASGLLVYQTDAAAGFYYYDGSGWLIFMPSTGSTDIATLGTITTGTWNGSIIQPTYGGTGVNNGSNTISLAGNLATSGANALTLTTTGTTNVTLPTTGTLVTNVVTSLPSLATVGTIGSGTWNGTVVAPAYGGTGVSNGSNTLALAGNLSTSGANALTLTTTGATNVTLPTTGTLVNNAVTTLSSLASVGTITTGTWNGTTISATNGGTGQTSWTLGDIPYSSATNTVSKLAGNTTATKQYLTQTGNGSVSAAPSWGAIAAADLPSAIDAAKLANGTVSNTEYQFLDGVSSAIQTQLNAKQASGSYAASGANTDITSVNLNQTGLTVKGATATSLTIRPNETLTTGRTLNLVTNDADRTVTLGGNITTAGALTTSGANALTLTTTGATNVTLPTTGTLVNSAVTSLSSLATVGTITSGIWNGTVVSPTYGGTGVNNGSSTLTLAGNLATSGANALTLTTTGATNVTLPTTGTLVNSAVTTLSSLASVGTITTGTWNGTAVGPTFGGTGITSWTLGDMLYANGSNTVSKLAGNTTVTKQFLTQTGNGSVSASPLWGAIAAADLPSAIDAAKLANGTVSNTEYQFLDGVTSAIQTQINTKAAAGANTDITSVNLNQTGLTVKGASATSLTIRPNETLTSPRTLNLVTNDADRTITMSGNLTVAGTASVTGTNTGDQTNITGNAGTVTGLSVVSGKTLTVNNNLDLSGTDGTGINIGAATNGNFLIGNGSDMVLSTSTIPTSAGATANKLLLSDGTNYALSTPTFPNASATTGKVIKSDGTNWVASTETYPAPSTDGNIMESDGTNWTSVVNPSEPKWDTYQVSGADATTTGQTLTNITGLVTGTLATNTSYEFEAVLDCGTSAVNTGCRYGANVTVAPTRILAVYTGAVTSTTGATTSTNANNTADATSFLTTSGASGVVVIKGIFRTAGSGSPVFSIRFLKVTSGTATVRIGSILRVRAL